MNQQVRQILAMVALASLVALAGCGTVSVTSEVEDAQTISTYEVRANMSTEAYSVMNEGAKEQGYDDVSSLIADRVGEPGAPIDTSTNITGDRARVSVTATDVAPSNLTAVNMTVRDGRLYYHDRSFAVPDAVDESQSQYYQSVVVEYELTMPGEINSSTADEVDGDTATWRETGADAFSSMNVSASSPAPSEAGAPGLGPLVAIVAFVVLGLGSAIRD